MIFQFSLDSYKLVKFSKVGPWNQQNFQCHQTLSVPSKAQTLSIILLQFYHPKLQPHHSDQPEHVIQPNIHMKELESPI